MQITIQIDDRLAQPLRLMFSRRGLAVLVGVVALGFGVVANAGVEDDPLWTGEFSAGTAISASQINNNFDVLAAMVDDLKTQLDAVENSAQASATYAEGAGVSSFTTSSDSYVPTMLSVQVTPAAG